MCGSAAQNNYLDLLFNTNSLQFSSTTLLSNQLKNKGCFHDNRWRWHSSKLKIQGSWINLSTYIKPTCWTNISMKNPWPWKYNVIDFSIIANKDDLLYITLWHRKVGTKKQEVKVNLSMKISFRTTLKFKKLPCYWNVVHLPHLDSHYKIPSITSPYFWDSRTWAWEV